VEKRIETLVETHQKCERIALRRLATLGAQTASEALSFMDPRSSSARPLCPQGTANGKRVVMHSQGNLDFLIIGAQKSGTTSLFNYLRAHPEIYMPPGKEVAFFHDDREYVKGKDWYLRRHFADAPLGSKKGEASPHYMLYKCVPQRVHSFFPQIKLIALLRNPIERAYSHYRMAVRRGLEKRTFLQCIVEDAEVGEIPDSRIDHNKNYFFFGEYGRILSNYFGWFAKDQIKMLFSEDLLRERDHAISGLYQFIGVNPEYLPQNLDRLYHESGVERVPGLTQWLKRQVRGLRTTRLGSKLLKRVDVQALLFRVETSINVKPTNDSGPSLEARERLAEYYKNDVELLKSVLGATVPWPEFGATRDEDSKVATKAEPASENWTAG
jgi:hypothetical protein